MIQSRAKVPFALMGAIAGCTIAAGSAQAVTLTYQTTYSVKDFLQSSVASGSVSFTKSFDSPGDDIADLTSGQAGYKVKDFAFTLSNSFASLLNLPVSSLTLADLLAADKTTVIGANTQVFSLLGLLSSTFTKYDDIIPNIVNGAKYDYIGDGDFPPADGSYAYSGFTFSYASTLLSEAPGNSAAVPEPLSIAGMALAGGGLAALRRRRAA